MAIFSKIIDIVVLVQEGHADLADRKIACEAVVVVLIIGCGQSVS